MQIGTIADITPGGSATKLSATAQRAIFVALTATGATLRIGDSNVGAARGALLQAGVYTVALPRQDNEQAPYDLSTIYVYGSGGDKVSVTYGY